MDYKMVKEVHKRVKPSTKILKVVMIGLCVLFMLWGIIFDRGMMFLALLMAGMYFLYDAYVIKDYEYVMEGNTFTISVIHAKSRRREEHVLDLKDMEVLAPNWHEAVAKYRLKGGTEKNDTLKQVVQTIVKMAQEGVLLLSNSWSDYTDQAIQGDQVAGVMNGNWIIPTMEKVEANSGKWEITTMPTLTGKEGYASNGGSSLYITANCKKTELAKDFLAYTFGGSTATYDKALTDGGVISCYAPAGQSEVYNQGVAFFNDQPIYATIVEMGTQVQTIEQSDYHYTCRTQLAAAIINIINGGDIDEELQLAEDQLNHEMGN